MSIMGESKVMEEYQGNYSVLIVDDDPNNLNILGQYLKRDGFLVVKASLATEALEILNMMIPDAIMLDYQMPNLNGIEALKLIRKKNQSSVVVMMTAYSAQEVSDEALTNQADDFLSKPLKFKSIGTLLKKHIKAKKTENAHILTSSLNPQINHLVKGLYSRVLVIRDSTPVLSYGNWDISQNGQVESPDEDSSTDNILISGFLTAIHNFSTNVFGENLGEISMGASQLLLRQMKAKHEYLICLLVTQKIYYWIGKNNLKEYITETLDKILNEFLILDDQITLELNELIPLMTGRIEEIIQNGVENIEMLLG